MFINCKLLSYFSSEKYLITCYTIQNKKKAIIDEKIICIFILKYFRKWIITKKSCYSLINGQINYIIYILLDFNFDNIIW